MDRYKLEYEIKKSGHSLDEFCTGVGIGKSAFYRRLRGEVDFSRSEIQRIVAYLELKSPVDIFFSSEVS